MKKAFRVFLLFLMLFSAKPGNAQVLDNFSIYYNGGISAGNYFGVSFGLNVIYKEKYAIQAGYRGLIRGAESKPNDYRPGLEKVFLIRLGSPNDNVESYEVLLGRVVKLNASESIRLNLKGGATLSKFSEATNWQEVKGSIFANYAYENVAERACGLIINPEIEFPVGKFFGFAISPFGIYTKEHFITGVELKALAGLLK